VLEGPGRRDELHAVEKERRRHARSRKATTNWKEESSMTERIRGITEKFRLGRHVDHDERSKNFAVKKLSGTPKSTSYERYCPAFDQGDLGSCTGNAMAGCLMTGPFWKAGRMLTETDAVRLYTEATHLDRIRGSYPPDDTGSSGLAVAKAAKKEGWVTAYEHAFGLEHLQTGLAQRPGILGINWYTSFDNPLKSGECPLSADAEIRGGHEIEMFRLDMEAKHVWCYQSWGPKWGGLKNGTFFFSFETLNRLLLEHGDAVFPVVPT
jgi:hypothetical protein